MAAGDEVIRAEYSTASAGEARRARSTSRRKYEISKSRPVCGPAPVNIGAPADGPANGIRDDRSAGSRVDFAPSPFSFFFCCRVYVN